MNTKKLSTKDNKLFHFGYWLLNEISPEIRQEYMSRLSNVDKQIQLFDKFWNDFKETEKTLKIEVKNANKKEPKEKKKRGRPRKEKRPILYVWGNENELLNKLIAEAQKEIQEQLHKPVDKMYSQPVETKD